MLRRLALHITMVAAALGLTGSLPAATVTLKIEPTSSPTVPPNGAVSYRVLGRVEIWAHS